jgi:hypothetical protein
VNEQHQRPGTWSVELDPDTPTSITDTITGWVDENAGAGAIGAHIVITPIELDPTAVTDTALLGAAIYTGPITARPTRTRLEGVGLAAWLDDYLDADLTRSTGTPTQWIGDLDANDLTAGTITDTGATNITRTFKAHSVTRRQALDAVASAGGWEWVCRPDFTIDAAIPATLFKEVGDNGTIVVTAHEEGPDGLYRGVNGGMLDQNLTRLGVQLPTKAVALGSGDGTAIAKGTDTVTRNLKAPKGSTPTLVDVFSAPSDPDANIDTSAEKYLNLQGMRRQVTVSSTTDRIRTLIEPGDECYLYDLESGLYDTANQIQFRGETITPAQVRLLSLNWPIEAGMGVYVRSNAATPTWLDVSRHVTPGDPTAWWTVGDWSPARYGPANRTQPDIEERIVGLGFTVGEASGTTDGSGDLVITHNFGSTPTSAVATSRGSAVNHLYVRSISSTTLTVRCYLNGTVQTSTSVAIAWIAFG